MFSPVFESKRALVQYFLRTTFRPVLNLHLETIISGFVLLTSFAKESEVPPMLFSASYHVFSV